MARSLRIECPGALYHLTSRGNAQEDLFRDDADCEECLAVLAAVVERFGWRLYASCLMDNHCWSCRATWSSTRCAPGG
jgi:putative transposase